MPKTFSIKIVGPAGTGVMSVGESLFRACLSAGYYCLGYPEYPSLIKGGHNTFLITLSSEPFPNNSPRVDLLLPLTQGALDLEHNHITDETCVVCDAGLKIDHTIKHLYQPDLVNIAKTAGNLLTLNTAIIAFAAVQLKLNPDSLLQQLLSELAGKPQAILDSNKKAFQDALVASQKYHLDLSLPDLNNKTHHLSLTGSEAVGLGAISAGLNLFAGYPMTPSSPLLHFLAAHQTEFNYLVRQTEDELSAINMIIGASYAGAKSMTGTSGGGFALMNEGLSLAGMIETPIVVYLAMRPGPATSMPTWTSQSDLLFAINAGHGEFPRIILAPSDPLDCYLLTHQAFALAQMYHIPVIILSDKYLAENHYSVESLPKLDTIKLSAIYPETTVTDLYPRYKYTPEGVSNRTLPGMPNGQYIANSDEHDAKGLVDESAEGRQSANQRRLNKMATILKSVPDPEIIQRKNDLVLISWGSHRQIVESAAQELNASHLHFHWVWPLPENLKEILANYSKIVVVENNNTHQFSHLITMSTGIIPDSNLGLDNGRPLDPDWIVNEIKKL